MTIDNVTVSRGADDVSCHPNPTPLPPYAYRALPQAPGSSDESVGLTATVEYVPGTQVLVAVAVPVPVADELPVPVIVGVGEPLTTPGSESTYTVKRPATLPV